MLFDEGQFNIKTYNSSSTLSKQFTETIALREAIIKSVGLTKQETFALIETSARIFSAERQIVELLPISEVI